MSLTKNKSNAELDSKANIYVKPAQLFYVY